ncbi:hypothetical protein HKB01_05400, partial [Vibrio parahaemolyticus]|nr:zinc-finger homeodomain protein [Vibrio parahaemolyticus]NMR96703.1 hypothetical protein [Vibrio parahaemolyticus]
FSNGVLKRHHANHRPNAVVYKECLKNHVASLGGHALDGCGEFMPSPTATAADPSSIKCAACGCHRNFHRKVKYPVAEHEEYGGKKRFRSKFTADQKEKMLGFAEKLGWKLQRKDLNDEIERFCRSVGVSRQVFKVWMHNHKNYSSSSSTAANVSSLTQ